MSPELEASYTYCRRLARRAAGNFYRGMRLTPEPKRSSIFAIYAWMRTADDLADGPGAGPDRAEVIDSFRQETVAAIDPAAPQPGPGGLWLALRDTVDTYGIPVGHLHAMLDGQVDDLGTVAVKDFGQLERYCYRVASVVGLTCVKVWGDDGDPAVGGLAERRGVALQLTNVLRDVAEDAERGRVYLPADELARFGVSPDQLRAGPASADFLALMRFQIDRARAYYAASAGLEQHLTRDCRATSWAIMRTYRVLLERIARRPDRVLCGRVGLSLPTKLAVVGGALAKRWVLDTGSERGPSGTTA